MSSSKDSKDKITFFASGFNGSALFGIRVNGVAVKLIDDKFTGAPEDLYYYLKIHYPEIVSQIVNFYKNDKGNHHPSFTADYPEAVLNLDSSYRVEIGSAFCECDK